MPSSLHFGTRTKLKPEETVILSFVVHLLLSETEPDPGKRRRFKAVKFYQVENIQQKKIPVPLPETGFSAAHIQVNRPSSEERRVGKECVSTFISQCTSYT